MRIEHAYTVFDKHTGSWIKKPVNGQVSWSTDFNDAHLFESTAVPRALLGVHLFGANRYVLQEVSATWVIKKQSNLTLEGA